MTLREREKMPPKREERKGIKFHHTEKSFLPIGGQGGGIIVRIAYSTIKGHSRDPAHCQCCGEEARPQGGMLYGSQAC